MTKIRADEYLFKHYSLGTIEDVRRLIMDGKVLNNNEPIYKASDMIKTENASIRFKNVKEYVSRGGIKLKAAIQEFSIDLNNKTVLDIGSSTGGFTDCSLKHGATHVYAVDVGTNQLDYKLRVDDRVTVMEQTNFKDTVISDFKQLPDVLTIDVSFTSIVPIINHITELFNHEYTVIALIKPQFESYLEEKEDTLIIQNVETKKNVIRRVVGACTDLNLSTIDVIHSPITGTKGNEEFLLYIKNNSSRQTVTNKQIESLF